MFSRLIKVGFVVLAGLLLAAPLRGQYIPTHLSNTGIYEFMDELAALKVIELNSAIKPYSRSLISEKLMMAAAHQDQLNARQSSELAFYLKDYSGTPLKPTAYSLQPTAPNTQPETSWLWINRPQDQRLHFFSYSDTIFRITANPILGGNLWSNQHGTFHHWWNGVQTEASYGKFALFASIRDNHESDYLTNRDFMNQRIGLSNYKGFSGTTKRDYWEIRGGITYEWNWGHIGLLMDQFSWGDAHHGSNIFSGRTPAFSRIDLQLDPAKWLRFNYVHGWLISEVVDSTLSFWVNNSYGPDYREVYHPKFLAANMFTFRPFPHLYVGVGNSVIYDYRSPHAAFFIPVMFWKPLDHTLNARINNMNSQMFMTLSSRNLRGVHLYGSAFIDEVQVGRIFRDGEYNFTSVKFGTSIIPAFIHRSAGNIKLIFEYTWSNSLVFRHNVPTTTFESNQYNLGHFLEDNARDIYAAVEFRPWRTLRLKAWYNFSEKGPDHTLLGTMPRTTHIPLDPVVWESERYGISASMQIVHDLYLRFGYEIRTVTGDQEWIDRWTPSVY
ncbi:MAG: hypothetical protein P1P82_18150, partial [Bacteroidales bacterium]|nr:hypothetical protein [Bacteroidales bacterium]